MYFSRQNSSLSDWEGTSRREQHLPVPAARQCSGSTEHLPEAAAKLSAAHAPRVESIPVKCCWTGTGWASLGGCHHFPDAWGQLLKCTQITPVWGAILEQQAYIWKNLPDWEVSDLEDRNVAVKNRRLFLYPVNSNGGRWLSKSPGIFSER